MDQGYWEESLDYPIGRVEAWDTAALKEFVALHEEAATWLWRRGIRQWRPGEYTYDILRAELIAGHELYLARRAGMAAGGFTLQWIDEEVWGPRPLDEAGYLHALCVSRAEAGRGLGPALLDYAGLIVANAGCPWLRLDCWKGNVKLRTFYELQGFAFQGVDKSGSVALYQRRAGEVAVGGGVDH